MLVRKSVAVILGYWRSALRWLVYGREFVWWGKNLGIIVIVIARGATTALDESACGATSVREMVLGYSICRCRLDKMLGMQKDKRRRQLDYIERARFLSFFSILFFTLSASLRLLAEIIKTDSPSLFFLVLWAYQSCKGRTYQSQRRPSREGGHSPRHNESYRRRVPGMTQAGSCSQRYSPDRTERPKAHQGTVARLAREWLEEEW